MKGFEKMSTDTFWYILWNQEEEDQLRLFYEFMVDGARILEDLSGDMVSVGDIRDRLKMFADNAG